MPSAGRRQNPTPPTIKPQGVERLPKMMPNAGEIIERLARENERQNIMIEQLQRELEAVKAEAEALKAQLMQAQPHS